MKSMKKSVACLAMLMAFAGSTFAAGGNGGGSGNGGAGAGGGTGGAGAGGAGNGGHGGGGNTPDNTGAPGAAMTSKSSTAPMPKSSSHHARKAKSASGTMAPAGS